MRNYIVTITRHVGLLLLCKQRRYQRGIKRYQPASNEDVRLLVLFTLQRWPRQSQTLTVDSAMNREQFRLKRDQFKRDMHRLSEDKTRQLFEKEEDRETWVEVIRNSVEKEIESRVRQALGTPPKERQRKRLEEFTAQRIAKIEEEKRAMATSILNSSRKGRTSEEEEEELSWTRRQKYLEKFNRRRTMRETRPSFNTQTQRWHATQKSKIDSPDNASNTSPIVWKSCETIPTDLPDPRGQFKRGVDTKMIGDARNDLLVLGVGPYFPTGRLPCMAAPKHLQCIPSFVENLNTPGEYLEFAFS